MATSAKAQEALAALEEKFNDPKTLTEGMARTLIRPADGDEGRPMDSWSWSNRFIAILNGTEDARTYNAWKKAGRHVKKGAKAFYILRPNKFQATKKDRDGNPVLDSEGKPIKIWIVGGFDHQPEFRVEDTEGKELPSYDYTPEQLPPLMDVAGEWGIKVKWQATRQDHLYGWCNYTEQEIGLLTHDQEVFFHELVHAADNRNYPKKKAGQDPDREAVAEIGAAVLARLYGKDTDRNAFEYIKSYAPDPAKKLVQLSKRIETALNEILGTAGRLASEKESRKVKGLTLA